MIKKELTFLIVFLISLPGCGGGSKKTSAKKIAQRGGGFSRVSLPLAADGSGSDANVRSFFDDDMNDFTVFAGDDVEQGLGKDRYSELSERTRNGFKVSYFGFDQHAVSSSEKGKIKENAAKIKQLVQENKDITVVVEGHACASAGSAAYNLALSEKRAKSYGDILQANGVPANRIKRVGRGNEMLVVKTGGRDEQWINRRVELYPVSEGATA